MERNSKGQFLKGHRSLKPYGQLASRLAPTEQALSADFQWAAGFYEGEGYARRMTRGEQVIVAQKDPWSLERLRALFGGSITHRDISTPAGNPTEIYNWSLTGARARGFLMSIYGLLSPRRQEQARKALAVGEFVVS